MMMKERFVEQEDSCFSHGNQYVIIVVQGRVEKGGE